MSIVSKLHAMMVMKMLQIEDSVGDEVSDPSKLDGSMIPRCLSASTSSGLLDDAVTNRRNNFLPDMTTFFARSCSTALVVYFIPF